LTNYLPDARRSRISKLEIDDASDIACSHAPRPLVDVTPLCSLTLDME